MGWPGRAPGRRPRGSWRFDELLQRLLGVLGGEARRDGDARRQGFDALAFTVLEQSLEIDAAPEGLLLMREVVAEDGGIILKAVEDVRRQFGCVGLAHNDHTNNTARRFVESNGVVLRAIEQNDYQVTNLKQIKAQASDMNACWIEESRSRRNRKRPN